MEVPPPRAQMLIDTDYLVFSSNNLISLLEQSLLLKFEYLRATQKTQMLVSSLNLNIIYP